MSENVLRIVGLILLRRCIVEQMTCKSRSSIYRDIEKGLFVEPVVISRDKNGEACQVAWPKHEVEAIIAARIAGKTDEEIKTLIVQIEAARAAQQEAA